MRPTSRVRTRQAPARRQGDQSHISLNDEQTANAKAIIAATKKAGLPERAAVISIATSLQESKLENLGHLGDMNDHDSLGLFQQRPTQWLGHAGADHRPRVLHHRVPQGPQAGRRLAGHAADRGRADGAGLGLPGRLRPVGAAGHRPRRRRLEQLTHTARQDAAGRHPETGVPASGISAYPRNTATARTDRKQVRARGDRPRRRIRPDRPKPGTVAPSPQPHPPQPGDSRHRS